MKAIEENIYNLCEQIDMWKNEAEFWQQKKGWKCLHSQYE